jgi:Sec-independent protein translocase protein TatA
VDVVTFGEELLPDAMTSRDGSTTKRKRHDREEQFAAEEENDEEQQQQQQQSVRQRRKLRADYRCLMHQIAGKTRFCWKKFFSNV